MLTRGWLVSAGLLFTTLAAAADRPNILICMADDWGWPHAGAYGDAVVQTPTFDALARDGVLFSHAYVSSPSCTPSRNATLTGQQFYRLDQGANLHSSLDPRHPNFLLLVRDAGYQVGHWRKAWGPGEPRALGYRESPVGKRQSFDQFLAQRDPSKPFCFWFGTTDPHRGYEAGNGAKSGMDLAAIHVPDFYPDAAEIRSDMADYYWEVQRWDREVGAAIDLVKQAGELENTIIVMTGDHGMPFPRCKGNLYDWGTRVPLAVRWTAEVAPGRQLDNFVSLTDLAPTFLQAAGVAVPANMTGHSLLPLLTAPGSARPDVDDRVVDRSFVVFGRERHVPAQRMPSLAGYPARAIRTDRWLLVLNAEPDRWPAGVPRGATHPIDQFADCDAGPTKAYLIEHQDDPDVAKHYRQCFAKRPAMELYDCQNDPDQIHNLASDPQLAPMVDRLRQQLLAYLQETADPRFTDGAVEFDDYPYRAAYLQDYLKQHGH